MTERTAQERLDDLEARLDDERLDELLVYRPFASVLLIDGVPEEALRRDRPALRSLIADAREHYRELLAGVPGPRPPRVAREDRHGEDAGGQ